MSIDSVGGAGQVQPVLRARSGAQKPSFQDSFEVGQSPDTVEISSEARKRMSEMLDPLLPAGVRASSLKGIPEKIAQEIAVAQSPRGALAVLDDWNVSSEEKKKFDQLGMLLRKNI